MKETMKAYPCAAIPRLVDLLAQAELKETLMRETGGGEAFVERAAATIKRMILQTRSYQFADEDALLRTLGASYSQDQIAHALAQAWLDGNERFFLPRARYRDKLSVTKFLVLIAIAMAFLSDFALIEILHIVAPDIAIVLMRIPPVLAITGFVIAFIVFWALSKFVERKRG
jgi:hypothetical protein